MTSDPIKRTLVATAMMFLVTGCALKHEVSEHTTPDQDATIEKYLAIQEYTKALEFLQGLEKKRGEEDFSPRKLKITTRIKEFEKNTISEAQSKAGREEFVAALAEIDNALKKVPASKALAEFQLQLVLERDQSLEEARNAHLILEAEYLLARLKWYGKQAHLEKPSLISRWQSSIMEGSLNHLRNKLLNCEKKETELGNKDLAAKCLLLAIKIRPDSALEKIILPEKKPEPPPEELSETKKSKPEQNTPSSAAPPVSETDISAGQKAETESKESENLTKMLIEQNMQEGASLYRAGKISEARDAWQKVLALDKDHLAAQEQVARAEKILKRLDKLKKANQPSENK